MTDEVLWLGAAQPMPAGAFAAAAAAIGCDEAVSAAVWDVEASGRGFRGDGTVQRRFEPHKMPGATTTWRDSRALTKSRREAMFAEAYAESPAPALDATSWGGPQIMGFNAPAAGFRGAREMVKAMADDEAAHLEAFVRLITAWGLDAALRAHDWRTFTRRYNGSGQVEAYSRKIEAAWRRHSGGSASPVVLRIGDNGEAVRRLQRALGIPADGEFGPVTEAAVRAFQGRASLPIDGVVGRRTWSALQDRRAAAPPVQETPADGLAGVAQDWLARVGGGVAGGVGVTQVLDRAPPWAVNVAWGGALLAGAVLVAALVWRRWRRV